LSRPVDIPTAPVAAASLILGYAVAVSTGSRPLGGVVLAAGGLWCIRQWFIRHGRRTALTLGCVGLAAFVLSHLVALAIGAWPAVLLAAGFVATVVWLRADTRTIARGAL
jgi:CHASE2 domain-containing sensor protein